MRTTNLRGLRNDVERAKDRTSASAMCRRRLPGVAAPSPRGSSAPWAGPQGQVFARPLRRRLLRELCCRAMPSLVGAAALCALITLCTAAAAATTSAPIVSTASGKVQGQSFGAYNRFLGSLASYCRLPTATEPLCISSSCFLRSETHLLICRDPVRTPATRLAALEGTHPYQSFGRSCTRRYLSI